MGKNVCGNLVNRAVFRGKYQAEKVSGSNTNTCYNSFLKQNWCTVVCHAVSPDQIDTNRLPPQHADGGGHPANPPEQYFFEDSSGIIRVDSVSESTSLSLHVQDARSDVSPSRHQLCPLPQALSHHRLARSESTVFSPKSSNSPVTNDLFWSPLHDLPCPPANFHALNAYLINDTASNTFHADEEDDEFQATLHQLATAEWRSNDPTPTNTPSVMDITSKVWSASSQGGEPDEATLMNFLRAGRDAFGTSLQSDGSRPSQRISDSMAANADRSLSLMSGPSPLRTSKRSDASGDWCKVPSIAEVGRVTLQ